MELDEDLGSNNLAEPGSPAGMDQRHIGLGAQILRNLGVHRICAS